MTFEEKWRNENIAITRERNKRLTKEEAFLRNLHYRDNHIRALREFKKE
jgi:hypothetical protein